MCADKTLYVFFHLRKKKKITHLSQRHLIQSLPLKLSEAPLGLELSYSRCLA